jgi:hypothetical protein
LEMIGMIEYWSDGRGFKAPGLKFKVLNKMLLG